MLYSLAMRVAIVGGGFSGLYAASRLALSPAVDVFEASDSWGGLAGATDLGPLAVDRYYHFICRGDDRYLALIGELGLGDRVHFSPSRTGFFCNGRLYPFSTPLDLLRFGPLSPVDRLRFGFHIIASRHRTEWEQMDKISARDWLIAHLGRRGYETVWEPLLRMKFGARHDAVSAAWIWHRIHRVARSRAFFWSLEHFGTLEGGTACVIDRLLAIVRGAAGGLHLRTPVTAIRRAGGGAFTLVAGGVARGPYDAVLSTVAFPLLGELVAGLDAEYSRRLGGFESVGVRCLTLRLARRLTPCFWLNVNDARIPFNGIIEMTNIQPREGEHLVYIPAYVPADHRLYLMPDAEFVDLFLEALPRIAPGFDRSWVRDLRVSRDRYAQPVCTVGIAGRIPGVRAPVPGLFQTESLQIYPEDRTLSGMARMADQALEALRSHLVGRSADA